MKRKHYVLLAVCAVIGLIIFNPIGSLGAALIAGPIWLWCRVIVPYVNRRHETKLAKMIADEERGRPEIPAGQSILVQVP